MPTPLYLRPSQLRDSVVCVAEPDVYVHGITSVACPDDLASQTTEVLAALDKALAEAGSSKNNIVHLWVKLSQGAMAWLPEGVIVPRGQLISDYIPAFRTIYEAWVTNPPPPRTLQWSGLDKSHALIEVTAIASRKEQ